MADAHPTPGTPSTQRDPYAIAAFIAAVSSVTPLPWPLVSDLFSKDATSIYLWLQNPLRF